MRKVRFIITILVLIYSVGIAAPHSISAKAEDAKGYGKWEHGHPPCKAGHAGEYDHVSSDNADTGHQFAQVPPGIEGRDVPGQGEHRGWTQGKHRGWNKDKIKKLKEEDPERFQALMEQRRGEIRNRLSTLKEQDPERYDQLRSQIQQRRRMNMQKLKQEDPEKYQEMMGRRRENMQQRLEQLKVEDPERYEQVNRGIQEIKEFQSLRRENPEAAREYLSEHQGLRERLEKRGRGQGGDQGGPGRGRGPGGPGYHDRQGQHRKPGGQHGPMHIEGKQRNSGRRVGPKSGSGGRGPGRN